MQLYIKQKDMKIQFHCNKIDVKSFVQFLSPQAWNINWNA